MERFSLPKWSARNPLGIIALFISLIYGMSALLLGTSISYFSASNQTTLVAFIVSFPFVVLGLFAWLVAKHHQKLYGPGDYRSDEGFLNALNALPPTAIGERLRDEISHDEQVQEKQEAQQPSTIQKVREKPSPAPGVPEDRTTTVDTQLLAYSAENLVFEELQREFNARIQKRVTAKLGRNTPAREFDGIIELPQETILIEVKILRSLGHIKLRVRKVEQQFRPILNEALTSGVRSTKLLLAMVYLGSRPASGIPEKSIEEASASSPDVIVRLYYTNELLPKYGFG
jgi:hypothetical protein